MYLNQVEINAIKAKVQAGEEPWKTAFNKLILEANQNLNKGPWSVTYGGPTRGHDYYAERPYCGWKRKDGRNPDCRDGQINPDANRFDYNSAEDLSQAVRNLGLAYVFTGQSKYANRVVELIRTWALDPATYMTPKFTQGQSYITLSITLPGMFYAADLIWNYPGWPASEKKPFKHGHLK